MGGGQQVRWGRRGADLFYVAADQRLTSVPVTFAANGAAVSGRSGSLFEPNSMRLCSREAILRLGRRTTIPHDAPTDAIDPPSITVFLNWQPKP
jgi:hypothetical protein